MAVQCNCKSLVSARVQRRRLGEKITVAFTNSIQQDSMHFAEKITTINGFHIHIHRVRIRALENEEVATAETSNQPSDSC
jgi:hypothetical protein